MPLVYITGVSGAGKSAVCEELTRRGYDAHDTDKDDNAVWVSRATGEVIEKTVASAKEVDERLDEHEWRVVRQRVEALERRADGDLVFLCGTTANEDEVWDRFSRVIYLAIDEQTLRNRLASRTSNDFGKTPKQLEAILSWHAVNEADYRRFGAVVVDATRPLHEVVDAVVDAAS